MTVIGKKIEEKQETAHDKDQQENSITKFTPVNRHRNY